jgi:hypothetical protein
MNMEWLKQHKSSLIIVLSLVVSGGIIAGSWFFVSQYPASSSPTPTSTPPSLYTPEQAMNGILAMAQLKLPDVQTVGAAAELPADLQFLVTTSTADLAIRSITYADGKQGFKVSYNIPGDLKTAHDNMRYLFWANQCRVLNGVWSSSAGLSEAEKGNYEIQLRETAEHGRVNYDILILAK